MIRDKLESVFHDVLQNTEEWDLLRLKKLTASTSRILKVKKTTKEYLTNLIDKKAFERIFDKQIEDEFWGNKWTERGHETEILAGEAYEQRTFRTCLHGGFYQLGEFLGASPDRRIEGLNGGVEIKCFGHKHHEECIEDPDKFLKDYYDQIQFQLYVTGFDFIDLFAFHPEKYKNVLITVKPNLEHFTWLENEIALAEEAIEKEMKNKFNLLEVEGV